MGKYEKYQNDGNLEGIDALHGCALQINRDASSSDNFHINFIALNYFRTILNVFNDDSRLEAAIKLQQELKDLIRTKPPFLAEFKLFPDCKALIQLSNHYKLGEEDDDLSIPEGSFLDELLREARKPENRLNRIGSTDLKCQLYELNEINLYKSLVPLEISFIERISEKKESIEKYSDAILREIDFLIELHYKNDIEGQRRLFDCLMRVSNDSICSVIDTISKLKRESINNSQKQGLLRQCMEIFKSTDDAALIQSVCKLLIDVLKCPEIISDPMNLIQISLNSPNAPGALKHLLTLPKLDMNSLILEIINDQIPLKNRLILLKGIGSRFSKELKHSTIEECKNYFVIWAELIQFIRDNSTTSNNNRLLHGIVKESHVVLESFLSCSALNRIESDVLLLEGSRDRESVLLLFKTVQQATRGLQVICNHLKYDIINKSSDQLAIPNLKRSLESVIFRVKELLTRSGCLGAFWMGNLKHRDLDGQELSSQVELLKIYEHESKSESGHDIDSSEGFIKLSESFIIDTDTDSEI